MSVTPKSQSQTIFYEISFKVRVDYNPTPPPPTLASLLTLFQCFNYVKDTGAKFSDFSNE